MIIKVEVKTGAKEESVLEIGEGLYRVIVKERRKKGKANNAVLRLLRKHFGGHPRIVSGLTSKTKIIEIQERS